MSITKENYKSITPRQWAAIIETLDCFEFDKVEAYMQNVNWCWTMTNSYGEEEDRIPNQSELRAALRSLLIRSYDSMNLNKDNNDYPGPYFASCGGFTVYVFDDDSCRSYFSVTDWNIDNEYIETL
jgi:hypothetical protein